MKSKPLPRFPYYIHVESASVLILSGRPFETRGIRIFYGSFFLFFLFYFPFPLRKLNLKLIVVKVVNVHFTRKRFKIIISKFRTKEFYRFCIKFIPIRRIFLTWPDLTRDNLYDADTAIYAHSITSIYLYFRLLLKQTSIPISICKINWRILKEIFFFQFFLSGKISEITFERYHRNRNRSSPEAKVKWPSKWRKVWGAIV